MGRFEACTLEETMLLNGPKVMLIEGDSVKLTPSLGPKLTWHMPIVNRLAMHIHCAAEQAMVELLGQPFQLLDWARSCFRSGQRKLPLPISCAGYRLISSQHVSNLRHAEC
jgi:hypothetical protein